MTMLVRRLVLPLVVVVGGPVEDLVRRASKSSRLGFVGHRHELPWDGWESIDFDPDRLSNSAQFRYDDWRTVEKFCAVHRSNFSIALSTPRGLCAFVRLCRCSKFVLITSLSSMEHECRYGPPGHAQEPLRVALKRTSRSATRWYSTGFPGTISLPPPVLNVTREKKKLYLVNTRGRIPLALRDWPSFLVTTSTSLQAIAQSKFVVYDEENWATALKVGTLPLVIDSKITVPEHIPHVSATKPTTPSQLLKERDRVISNLHRFDNSRLHLRYWLDDMQKALS